MIPDSVYAIPLQEGHYTFTLTIFTTAWDNYTTINSSGVNVNTGIGVSLFGILSFKIGGFFQKSKSVKENQNNYYLKSMHVNFKTDSMPSTWTPQQNQFSFN